MMPTRFQFIFILFIVSINSLAQERDTVDIAAFEKSIEPAIQSYRDEIEKEYDTTKLQDSIALEIKLDLYRAELFEMHASAYAYKTTELITAGHQIGIYYDHLVTRYYHFLLDQLHPEHKEVLIKSQENWLQYREAEIDFFALMHYKSYTYGGSLERVEIAGLAANMNEERLMVLINYIERIPYWRW